MASWENIAGEEIPATSELATELFSFLKPGWRILDVGCGTGRLSAEFLRRGCSVQGIDINKEAIAIAQRSPELSRASFSVQSATSLLFEDDYFDLVVSQAVLACMVPEDRQCALREMLRVLKPQGLVHLGEFGLAKEHERYAQDAEITGEYGTIVVRDKEGRERFRTHNFSKEELDTLTDGFNLVQYIPTAFKTVKRHVQSAHIYLLRKA